MHQKRPLEQLFSERSRKFELSGIRKMFDLVRPGAIDMTLGEPDFNPPKNVRRALRHAVEEGHNKYGPTAGIPTLRQALAERLRRWDKTMTPEQVLVTIGASEALFLAAATFYDIDDEVLIPDPGFVVYAPHVRYCRANAKPYGLLQENSFRPDHEQLKALVTPKTKAIVVNSPSNPTGGVLTEQDVRAIVDLAVDHDLVIISDEVYDEVVYDGEHHSFLGREATTVVVNSFSKTYATTGWRLGYLVADPAIVDRIVGLHHSIVACPPSLTQHAAVEALTGEQDSVKRMHEVFRKRRDLILEPLNRMPGVHCPTPAGAFYAFPRFGYDMSSQQFAMEMVKDGVIAVPGAFFGVNGEYHLRFSYATSRERILTGMERMAGTVERLAKTVPMRKDWNH